jgi:hypothetical protein
MHPILKWVFTNVDVQRLQKAVWKVKNWNVAMIETFVMVALKIIHFPNWILFYHSFRLLFHFIFIVIIIIINLIELNFHFTLFSTRIISILFYLVAYFGYPNKIDLCQNLWIVCIKKNTTKSLLKILSKME